MSAPFPDAPVEFRIGLGPIPTERWLQPDPSAAARKDALLAAHSELVWGEAGQSRPAQAEALAMIAAARPVEASQAPPLLRAARAVADDLCLMERRAGEWALTAASLCAPTFFSAAEAVGKPLAALHAPVPSFGERLLGRVERIFDSLGEGQVLERRNWTVVNSREPFLPDPAPLRARLGSEGPEALFLRIERQSLRRLPATGAVLFSIRVSAEPLSIVLAQPERRTAFLRAWDWVMAEAGTDFRNYKRLDLYDPLVRAALDRAVSPAVDNGGGDESIAPAVRG